MSEFQKPVSIPSRRPLFSVEGSPFNGLKVGAVMLLLGAIPLWWLVDVLLPAPLAQLLVVGGYGWAGMGWVVIRSRHIMRARSHGQD